MSVTVTRGATGAGWLAVAGATSVLATQLIGTPHRTIAALQALTPWAIPVLMAIAVVAAIAGAHRLGFAGSLVALGYLALVAPVVFARGGPDARPDATPITVAAINILYSNREIDELAASIGALDADVVALSEVPEHLAARLVRTPVADRYPYRLDRSGPLASGMLLWSRYPFESVDEVPGTLWRSVDAQIATPDGSVRVIAVHPPSPVFDQDAWTRELAQLPALAAGVDEPLVIMGDFNASWFHPPFRAAIHAAGLRDVLVDEGHGMAMTWPTDELVPPFVTLDHVLVDGALATVGGRAIAVPGSDHRGVVATVALAAG